MLISDDYISIESCRIAIMARGRVSYLVPKRATSWLDIAPLVLELVVREEPLEIPVWNNVICKKKEE
jgi:hypothetical protein